MAVFPGSRGHVDRLQAGMAAQVASKRCQKPPMLDSRQIAGLFQDHAGVRWISL